MHGIGGLIKWMLTRPRKDPSSPYGHFIAPAVSPVVNVPTGSESLSLTWIGHSTFLIQCDGVNVLTDPIWSRRASPVSFAGPSRTVPAPIPLADLPPIDVTLISHDHYDHLDDPTVRELVDRFPGMYWMVPLKQSI